MGDDVRTSSAFSLILCDSRCPWRPFFSQLCASDPCSACVQVTAQNLCFAHDAMQDGYFDGGQGGETGSGSGSSGPPPADGILTSTCRDSVLSNFGSLDCEPSDNCDTCDFLGYCIGCREGYELDVIFSDCTGYCVLKSDFVAGYHKSMKTALADNYCSHPSDLQCVEDQMSAVSSPAA